MSGAAVGDGAERTLGSRVLGPGSITWERGGDWRLLLLGGRSLVLQVAHPVVAAGVAEHSDYSGDPWRRLLGTLDLYVGGVLFGWPDGAVAAAERLREMHTRIRGVDAWGRPYHALDPEAFHWVHATLVDGAVLLFERFDRPLHGAELHRFYGEMRDVGHLYGLRERDMPPDWPSFRAYLEEMTRTRLEDGQVVRDVLEQVARPPRPPALEAVPEAAWRALVRPEARLVRLCTVGLLPPVLRERWSLPWSGANERELEAYAAVIRRAFPRLPDRLRLMPPVLAARRRAERSAAA